MVGKAIGRWIGKVLQGRQVESFRQQVADSELTTEEREALDPYIEVAARLGGNPAFGIAFFAILVGFLALVGLLLMASSLIVGLGLLVLAGGLAWYFVNNDYKRMKQANELKEILASNPRSLLEKETAEQYHHLLDVVDEVPNADPTPLPAERLESGSA